jgi:uncharacterized membrane protein YidH (DUF202 family)
MKTFAFVAAALVLPLVSFAQFGVIDNFLRNIMSFINNLLIPLIFAAALLMFIYGMYRYFIQGGDNDGDREVGQQLMIWAVVGFVLMVSIWGIVNLVAGGLQTGLGTNNSAPTSIPKGPSITP